MAKEKIESHFDYWPILPRWVYMEKKRLSIVKARLCVRSFTTSEKYKKKRRAGRDEICAENKGNKKKP